MECLSSLIGLKSLCEENASTPLFFLDDAEAMNELALAELARPMNGSGKAFGNAIIDSASRFLIADIESLVPKGYQIKSSLNSFCNTCTYTAVTSASAKTGIVVKNISTSNNSYLSIDSLKVMIQTTGSFTIVLDDGILPKQIVHDFTGGTEAIFTNINFKTSSRQVKIYFLDAGVAVTALSCPTTKSCGCSGSNVQSREISVKGLLNDVEFQTQYGFIPCASIVCSLDNIICSIVNQQPRLFALALFYRSIAMIWNEPMFTNRINATASFNKEEKQALADRYLALYYERLQGSENVKGISDNMAAVLNNLRDPCVECGRLITTAWATG